MAISIQKANFWKRFSAWMLDGMLVILLCTAIAFPMTSLFGCDSTSKQLKTIIYEYQPAVEAEYNVDLDVDYNTLSDEEKSAFDEADKALSERLFADEEYVALNAEYYSKLLSAIGASLLVSVLIAHFAIPLFLKNGQTLGKKVFGLATIRTNCVQATPVALFIRSAVGIFAIETVALAFLAAIVPVGTIAAVGMLILQAYTMIKTETNSAIHDLLSDTVVVDYSSQRIFDTEEEAKDFCQRMAEEQANTENNPENA